MITSSMSDTRSFSQVLKVAFVEFVPCRHNGDRLFVMFLESNAVGYMHYMYETYM